VRDVKSGRAGFTQTVTSVDGGARRSAAAASSSRGRTASAFAYTKPFEQTIVADGQKVWIYDADLNQASSRKLAQAWAARRRRCWPAAASTRTSACSRAAVAGGLDWALATPKVTDGSFKSLRVGFKGKVLAAVEIVDNFGQRSLLQFSGFAANAAVAEQQFRFVPPAGADVVEQ
jgi:outer membrane lipoprotein carrier protein